MTREAGWLVFYNPIAQREISVANYWNDPNHEWSNHEFNHFLPEVQSLWKAVESVPFVTGNGTD
jgi:hypothetical protein